MSQARSQKGVTEHTVVAVGPGEVMPHLQELKHTRNAQFIALMAGAFIVFGCSEIVYFALNAPLRTWSLIASGAMMVVTGIIGVAAAHSHRHTDAKALAFALVWYIRMTYLLTIINIIVLLASHCQSASCYLFGTCDADDTSVTCQAQLFTVCWLAVLGLVVPTVWLLMGCTRFATYHRLITKAQEDEEAMPEASPLLDEDEESVPSPRVAAAPSPSGAVVAAPALSPAAAAQRR